MMRSPGDLACDVVVIGSSNADMTVKCHELPLPGQTILGEDFAINPGGKGANQAVAAAKLGAKTQLVARLGNDVFAESSMNSFGRVGLGTEFIIRDDKHASGVALIFVDEQGENQIVVAPGANNFLTPADVDRALPAIERAKVMILQLEIPMETVLHAARLAVKHNTLVILNPAPARELPRELLEATHILIANETEVLVLTGAADVDTTTAAQASRPLIEQGVDYVITTLGAAGAVITSGDGATKVPGFKIKAVDTTSAGDTFTGATACGLAEGRQLEEVVRFANAAAALTATRHGAQIAMPSRQEADEKVASQ
jgi:ribokinase